MEIVIEIKNKEFKPNKMKGLFDYLSLNKHQELWDFMGLRVEIDPTLDFKHDDALIRWTDVDEGFNDKIIVTSLNEFKSQFKPLDA